MTATPTPLRDTIGHLRDIADVAERYTVEELRDVLREKADELEATLGAVDWTRPIETVRGESARLAFPLDPAGADVLVHVEIGCGRWAYNLDGTPIQSNGHMPRIRNVATPPASGEAGADDLLEIYPGDYVPVQVPAGWRPTTLRYETVGDAMRVSMSESDFNELRRLAAVAPAGMDGWIPVSERLPEYGEWITGRTAEGATWEEEFDPEEPLGRMTAWRPRLRTAREIKHPTPPATAGQE